MSLTTAYDFTLPRGYLDGQGRVHQTGTMRLATARDELEPLRDPTVSGPDDPRLTILVLTRVVERLGDLEMVTAHNIENLFAVDLAFLQDFYGVINFGTQEEYEALLRAQHDTTLVDQQTATPHSAGDEPTEAPAPDEPGSEGEAAPRRSLRAAVEEVGRDTGTG